MAEQLAVDYQKMLSQIDSRTFLDVEKLRLMLTSLRDAADLVEKSVI
jgi:hypothetical protein